MAATRRNGNRTAEVDGCVMGRICRGAVCLFCQTKTYYRIRLQAAVLVSDELVISLSIVVLENLIITCTVAPCRTGTCILQCHHVTVCVTGGFVGFTRTYCRHHAHGS